jgi:hypothetical protein
MELQMIERPAKSAGLKTAARWYTAAAVLLLNTIVLFVILNLLLWAGISAWHWARNDRDVISHGYSAESLRKVYPDLSDAERTALLTEIWDRPFVYEQFVEFRERPIHGKYVNVTEQGFRLTPPQGPWPIDPKNYNIFVLGGSTSFGYGVADDQTIPFYLQQLLANRGGKPICVYNFASGFYFSTQERIQFEQMLQHGIKPDLALFIDGLNDFYHASGVLPFTGELTRAMQSNDDLLRDSVEIFQALPIGKATIHFDKKANGIDDYPEASAEQLAQVVQHYAWNKSAIEALGQANGVATAFVFQPVPTYKYDLKYHLFQGNNWYLNKSTIAGYPLMAQYVSQHPMGDDFLWLADMQENRHEPLYVDQVHYTPQFAHDIAGEIGRFLNTRIIQR